VFKVHVHTFAALTFASLMQVGRSKISPFYFSLVDDGSGGATYC
jgi:hypothetical protein